VLLADHRVAYGGRVDDPNAGRRSGAPFPAGGILEKTAAAFVTGCAVSASEL
jgi:hypothetical protein